MHARSAIVVVGLLGTLMAAGPAVGQDIAPPVTTIEPEEASFVPVPGFPRGADFAVLSGDPWTGPFEMLFRLRQGVVVPMHFHSSAEQAVGIRGELGMRYPDGRRATIGPGTYMFIPWQRPHEASCPADGPTCLAYFRFDRAFDVTWVDEPPENPNPMPGGGR